MATAIKGYSGSVTAGGTSVGSAKTWEVTIESDSVDTTTFADGGWKANDTLLKSWSGSITTIFTAGDDTGEASVIAGLINGADVALVLNTGASGSGVYETYTGNAKITSMPISTDVAGIIETSFSFIGNGELVPTGNA